MDTYTATRTYKGQRATVTVTDSAGNVVNTASGKRAERASSVILAHWAEESFVRFWGLRQTAASAEGDARRLLKANTPAQWAIVIPVQTAGLPVLPGKVFGRCV